MTGASGGIGRATAEAFGRRGDSVALVARGEKGLEAAAEQVRAAGGRALVAPADVADAEQVEAAVDRIEQELGPIDIWVNVAFTSVFAPFDQIRADEFRRVTEVSYLGYVYATKAVLRNMKIRDRGTTVQVGSALAYRGIPTQTAYCGAKRAIRGFHQALRCELLQERSGVRVMMVQMPAVNTRQFKAAEAGAADIPAGSRRPSRPSCRRDPNQPMNLWQPADGERGHDFGAHGEFDGRSAGRSPQLWASQHHGVLAAAGGAGGVRAGLVGPQIPITEETTCRTCPDCAAT